MKSTKSSKGVSSKTKGEKKKEKVDKVKSTSQK